MPKQLEQFTNGELMRMFHSGTRYGGRWIVAATKDVVDNKQFRIWTLNTGEVIRKPWTDEDRIAEVNEQEHLKPPLPRAVGL